MVRFEEPPPVSSPGTVAVAIMCKVPSSGTSKTRLCPPLSLDECADLSACFISDLTQTMSMLARDGDARGYAVYTPAGRERALRDLLPEGFELVLQVEGDFGMRLDHGIRDLLARGHVGAILVNADSPTLPLAILRQAVDAVRQGGVVLSPAVDGGYTLIGLSTPHPELFVDIPWSTSQVFALTMERARQVGLTVAVVDGWYDVDDAESYGRLESELADGSHLAPSTRGFVRRRAQGTKA